MKQFVRSALTAISLAPIWLAGCGAEPDATGSDGVEPAPQTQNGAITDPAALGELNATVGAYLNALLTNDISSLENLVSDEVLLRAAEMDSDIAGFQIKMFDSLAGNLEAWGISEQELLEVVSVTGARTEGSSIAVDLAVDGNPIGKPFYFVTQNGEYKYNVRPAGFTNPLPDGAGAASRNTYRIENYSRIAMSFTCTSGGNVTVPKATYQNSGSLTWLAYGVKEISCADDCGWWSGSKFTHSNGTSLKCDYNTFGMDVYGWGAGAGGYQPYYWECNDRC